MDTENAKSKHTQQYCKVLAETGIVELVEVETYDYEDDSKNERSLLGVLCRLSKGYKEKDWVQRIVKPLRELCLGYEGRWTVITDKTYIDRPSKKTGQMVVAHGYRIVLDVPKPGEALELVRAAIFRSAAPKSNDAVPTQTYGGGQPTLLDFPDEVISKPLVGASSDRNVPGLKPSEYAHITGTPFKVGAGAAGVKQR